MTSRQPVGAAIVGAGLMGRWHADAIARSNGRIVVVVDPDAGWRDRLAARYAGCKTTADVAAAARTAGVDVVHVCTPLATHDALIRQALEAGRHVLAEKPLAASAADTATLLRLAQARGLLLCPVHQLQFQPGVLRAQRSLSAIGPLLHLEVVACSAGADDPGGERAELSGDAGRDQVAAEILPHPLSLFSRLLDGSLADAQWQVHHPRPGEIRAVGRVGAASVSALVSMGGRPTTLSLRLIGERGTTHVDLFHGFSVTEAATVSRSRKIAHPFVLASATLGAATTNLVARAARGESAYPGLRELVRRFYRAVRREGQPPISARETLDVAGARDAIIARL